MPSLCEMFLLDLFLENFRAAFNIPLCIKQNSPCPVRGGIIVHPHNFFL